MSLPTPSQSVSHKRFHQSVNHKKKLSLRHPLPTFGGFSFFQASIWLRVDKVRQKLTKVSSDIYFTVTSWFLENVLVKPYFNTKCPPPFLPTVSQPNPENTTKLWNFIWRMFWFNQHTIANDFCLKSFLSFRKAELSNLIIVK